MISTIPADKLRGNIDFAIITVREDEYNALLTKLPTGMCAIGLQLYSYSRIPTADGRVLSITVSRTPDQGQTIAHGFAREVIQDLAPRWLILAGIAGGFPDLEFTLGDVLLANSLHDFSISAALQDSPPEHRTVGATLHPDVLRLLSYISGCLNELGPWNAPETIGFPTPTPDIPDDLESNAYYGSTASRSSLQRLLRHHFPRSTPIRLRTAKVGALATSNVLLKDTDLLEYWKRAARQITHVDMEAGGVFSAARSARPTEIPFLCVRGISDVVGLTRQFDWTRFACHVQF